MNLTFKVKSLTSEEKREAMQQKADIIRGQGYKCFVCGKDFNIDNLASLGHRIPKYKSYIKKYGFEVIHHTMNLRGTCYGNCNDKVSLNPSSNPVQAQKLVNEIMADMGVFVNE